MTLTAHAVVGAAIVSVVPQYPALGLAAAFASHFLVDAIPHWDYSIRSPAVHPLINARLNFDRDLMSDAVSIGFDALCGFLLALLFFGTPENLPLILAGAFFGILPDPLQFVHGRWPHEPLRSLHHFHVWIHTNIKLGDRPLIGIPTQITFVAICVLVAKYIA